MSEPLKERRPRADALRNRERIVQAAIEAFREEGLEASVAEIARRAGVGSGTLFRNFPSKADLTLAVTELHMDRWVTVAQQLAAADDAAAAFDRYFAEAVHFNFADRGVLEAAKAGIFELPGPHECKVQALEFTQTLLDRAKLAGAVAEDVTVEDVMVLAAGAAEAAQAAVRETGVTPKAALARYQAIVLRGLRP